MNHALRSDCYETVSKRMQVVGTYRSGFPAESAGITAFMPKRDLSHIQPASRWPELIGKGLIQSLESGGGRRQVWDWQG